MLKITPLAIGLIASMLLLTCQTSGQQPPPGYTTTPPPRSTFRRPSIPDSILLSLPKQEIHLGKSHHFDLFAFGEVDTTLLRPLAEDLDAAANRLQDVLAVEVPPRPVKVLCYPSTEIKGLYLRDNRQANIDSNGTQVHLILDRYHAELTPSAPLELFLREIAGRPKTPALECGLAISACPKWQRLGAQNIARRLAQAELVPDLADLLDMEQWQTWSDIIAQALLADFMTYLQNTLSNRQFIQLYQNATLTDLLPYEKPWRETLTRQASLLKPHPPQHPPNWLQGFNFSHDGYQIYNGYGSRLAARALQAMIEMGSNAVAIVPYSFLRDAHSPAPIPIARFAGGENDEAVLSSCHHALEAGLYVLLKPQIWLGRGQWPGDVEMSTEQDWHTFFSFYTYWIAHYALLAEIHRIDGLCIGTELSRTTLQRPHEWRYLIKRLRSLYHGHLTYAANWGAEFEGISFWSELDFMGLNFYYPLSDDSDPTDAQLHKAINEIFEHIGTIAEREKKRIILTEIGYPTTQAPWTRPHDDSRDLPFSPTARNRCFQALFDNLPNRSWLAGILIWKWPTVKRPNRHNQPSFEIPGTSVEGLIESAFKTAAKGLVKKQKH